MPIDYASLIDKLEPIYPFTLYTPSLKNRHENDSDGAVSDSEPWDYCPTEMSDMNLAVVKNCIKMLGNRCKFIVEIGVRRNPDIQNTTDIYLNEKSDDCVYLGIDIEDRAYIKNMKPNVHFLQTDSGDYEKIMTYINTHIKRQIDMLFIDGWHSINQVGKEIQLINNVNLGGFIGFHDIAFHPGPNTWMDAFNPEYFEIMKFNEPNDYGIGILYKKKQ
jgi:hypothetical protein